MISAFLIVLNEAKNLPDCLGSVAFADEIVVVDSGSTDATVEIAKRLKARVVERPFTDFADQKNFALAQVRDGWAFSIDADERVPAELRDEILRTVALPNPAAAYRVPRRAYFRGRWLRTLYPDYQTRLFRKNAARFVGIVHEAVRIDGETGTLDAPLDHFGMPSVASFVRKIRRYAALDARKRVDQGERFTARSLVTQPLRELREFLLERQIWRDGWNGILVAALMSAYAAAVARHGRRAWRDRPRPAKPRGEAA